MSSLCNSCSPRLSRLDTIKPTPPVSVTYAEQMKLKHRLLLKVYGQEYDLLGFFVMRQPGSFYAAAYAEAPAPIMEFRVRSGREVEILRMPQNLKPEWILKAVVPDLLHIYSNQVKDRGLRAENGLVVARYQFEPKMIKVQNFAYPYELVIRLLEASSEIPSDLGKALTP